jgi:transcriptional regulator with XRE-family HTH domain
MPRRRSRDPRTDPGAALGAELSKAREAAGYATQEALAKALGYVREQVSKVESGGELPSDPLFAKWLDACRVPAARRQYLTGMLAMARIARSAIPDFAKPWLEAEREADALRLWASVMIPGLLQIEEYIRPQFEMKGMDENAVKDSVAARLDRQAILGGSDPVHVTALIHESVLYHRVGTPAGMAGQIVHLLVMSQRPNVITQVVKDTGYFPGVEFQFEIASGSEVPDTLVMVAIEDQTRDDRKMVRKAAAMFQEIHGRALPVTESRAVLLEAKEHWDSQQKTWAGASPATVATAAPTA